MKMNRFRANLHPAFFFGEREGSAYENFKKSVEFNEEEITNLQSEFISKDEIKKIKKDVIDDQRTRYENDFQWESDRKKFVGFLLMKQNDTEVCYRDLYEKRIEDGLKLLLKGLTSAGYFNKFSDLQSKRNEWDNVKKMYYKEVKNQYEKNIRYTTKKRFEKYKDTYFDENSISSPANKIYTKLTGAARLADLKNPAMLVEGRGVSTQNESKKPQPEGAGSIDKDNEKDPTIKEKIKFLSKTLPETIWDIKTKYSDWTIINKIPILNMFLSVGNYSESQRDREAIADFVELSSKITPPEGKTTEEILLDIFRNKVKESTGRLEYQAILDTAGLKLNGVNIDEVIKAGNYFRMTQRNGTISNNIYLNILKLIETEKGVKNVVKKYKDMIDKIGDENKSKRAYRKGKELEKIENNEKTSENLRNFAEKLGVTDFTNITNLKNLKDDYFKRKKPEQILANLNNDEFSGNDFVAGGIKSGDQFLSIYDSLDEQKKEQALKNLFDRAKLESQIYGVDLGLVDNPDVKTEIQKPNRKLIYLMQTIIANPGGTLNDLLKGNSVSSVNIENLKEDAELRKAISKYVSNNLDKSLYDELIKNVEKDKGSQITDFATLQSSMAACLYDNYKLGVGVSTHISFDEWVRGVKLEVGAQARGKDKGIFGINLSYDKTLLERNNWTLRGSIGAGVNFPIVSGKLKDPDLSANVGLQLDKRLVSKKKGSAWHVGVETGSTVNISGDFTVYAGLHGYFDKLEGLDEATEYWKGQMTSFVKSILNENGLNLNNVNSIKKVVGEKIKNFSDIDEKDRDRVTNCLTRILISYADVENLDEPMKDAIASQVGEWYSLLWKESKKSEESRKSGYFAGGAIGGFLTVATPRVGVYVDVRFWQKHYKDGFKDSKLVTLENRDDTFSESEEQNSDRNEKNIERFNKEKLQFRDGRGLKFENDLVKIPANLLGMVNIGVDMKGKVIKNDDGSISVSKWTAISGVINNNTGTIGRSIYLGDKKTAISLSNIDRSRYAAKETTSEILNTTRLIETNKNFYTVENIKQILPKILAKEERKNHLSDFNLNDKNIIEKINKLENSLEEIRKTPYKVKLIIERNKDGFDVRAENTDTLGSGFEIDYQVKLEMFNSDAEIIATKVYTQVSQIEDPSILYSVKHEKGTYYNDFKSDYGSFTKNLSSKNYEEAKNNIKAIFTTLDQKYNTKTNFVSILKGLDSISGEDLGQALYSINNIFARAIGVNGKKGNTEDSREYVFRGYGNMGEIIGRRSTQIRKTLDSYYTKKIKEETDAGKKQELEKMKGVCGRLILASDEYIKQHRDEFYVTNKKANTALNTMCFNRGDKDNPFNPLFNAEVYDINMTMDDLVKTGKFSEDDRKLLHKHSMEIFVQNDTLFHNIKKAFGAENRPVNVKKFELIGNTGKLTLDIGGKNVILFADMKFGYFTQCVNYMVMLENIQAESDGLTLNFGAVNRGNDENREANGTMSIGTINRNGHAAFTGGKEVSQETNSEVKTTGEVVNVGKGGTTNPEGGNQNTDRTKTGPGTNNGTLGTEL